MNFKQMNTKAQAGFTLIELMIVVAIIGILAAVAIPQYSNYTVKAKIASVLSSVASIKTAVGVCGQENGGALANCNSGDEGIPATFTTKEIDGVVVTAGEIVITLADGIGTDVEGTITMTPSDDAAAANLTWTNATTVTNEVAAEAITKNNPPA